MSVPLTSVRSPAVGWRVTWTSERGSGVDGPFTDLAWAIERVREHTRQMRVVTITPHDDSP